MWLFLGGNSAVAKNALPSQAANYPTITSDEALAGVPWRGAGVVVAARSAARSLRSRRACGPAMRSARFPRWRRAFGQRGGRRSPLAPPRRAATGCAGPSLRYGPSGAARLDRRGCRSALAAHPAVRRPCGQAGRMDMACEDKLAVIHRAGDGAWRTQSRGTHDLDPQPGALITRMHRVWAGEIYNGIWQA